MESIRVAGWCLLITAIAMPLTAGAAGSPSPASEAATPAAERLLLGFEEPEIRQLDSILTALSYPKASHVKTATVDGQPVVTVKMLGSGQGTWHLFKGHASQGQYAMGIGKMRGVDEMPFPYFQPRGPLPAEAKQYYGLFHDNYAADSGHMLNTCGLFRGLFPIDWSAYERLRMDVLCQEIAQTVRVALEDEEIAPPVVRNFRVQPGGWVTLEVDLRAAAKERRLDLKRMAVLSVAVMERHGKSGKRFICFMDNLRLSAAAAPADLPLLHDETPLALPDYYRASARPQPERMPGGAPERTPLKLGAPIVIATEKPARVSPVGWAAAYDNKHLLVGFNDGQRVLALQSVDAGATWRGLDGGEKPTVLPTTPYVDHQCGRGDVVGRRSDVVLLASNCNGGGLAGLRVQAQKVTFDGTGWRLCPSEGLVDCDPRHCTSTHSVIRTPDGRLWAAYGLQSRLATICINVRCSDDDGATWKSSRENTSGLIPWSLYPWRQMAGCGAYTFEEPCLVPFGNGIACLVQTRKRDNALQLDKLAWSRLDNAQWTPPETIETPKWTAYYTHTRPIVKAVSLRGEEIFVVDSLFDGVLHYKDGKWTREAPDVPANSWLCLAGEETPVAVGAVNEAGDYKKGPVTIRCWQRNPDGTWSAPTDVVREQTPLAYYENRPGFVVPAVSPPNFVPLAWSTGEKQLKFLRIPISR